MDSNHEVDFQKLLFKLQSGSINEVEKELLQEYIQAHYQSNELHEMMKAHWEKAGASPVADSDLFFGGLRERIWAKLSVRKERSLPVSNWKTRLVRIAAILTIPLLITSAYLFFRLQSVSIPDSFVTQQVFASPGSRVHVTLPDSSQVWLNSGSRLEYPVALNRLAERRVSLSGQGYFKVKHDAKHPFLVETSGLKIKVLGTSFDVTSYENEKQMSSTLEEGSIAVLNNKGEELARLKPGQQALLNRENHQLQIREVDTRLTTSWKDGKLIFKDSPFPEVVIQLERWYNCKIHVAPELMTDDMSFTGTIQNETLGEVLSMIEISTSVHTKITNREVFIWNKK